MWWHVVDILRRWWKCGEGGDGEAGEAAVSLTDSKFVETPTSHDFVDMLNVSTFFLSSLNHQGSTSLPDTLLVF